MVSKYIETMAAGALLFANQIDDFSAVPYEHYIPIKADTESLERIYSILEHPDDFDEIRKNGMRYVKEIHSLDITINRFRKWFDEL